MVCLPHFLHEKQVPKVDQDALVPERDFFSSLDTILKSGVVVVMCLVPSSSSPQVVMCWAAPDGDADVIVIVSLGRVATTSRGVVVVVVVVIGGGKLASRISILLVLVNDSPLPLPGSPSSSSHSTAQHSTTIM